MPRTDRPRPDALIFGNIFRQLRLQRGWNIRTCADHLQITPSYLGVLEAGRNMPSIHVLLLFGYAFDVPAWELMRSFEETRTAQIAAEAAAADE